MGDGGTTPGHIEIGLRTVDQLFNTMDPSPFHEKDLDADAEEFIVSWAQEFHLKQPLVLAIHLKQMPDGDHPAPQIETAVRHYFAYRGRITRLEFQRLMKEGRQTLLIGLCFLSLCLLSSELLVQFSASPMMTVLREGLTIGGWVAMWRPMEIYLYSWWPLRRRRRIFGKLARMTVEIHVDAPAT